MPSSTRAAAMTSSSWGMGPRVVMWSCPAATHCFSGHTEEQLLVVLLRHETSMTVSADRTAFPLIL